MLITLDQTRTHRQMEDFVDSFADSNLTYYASDLLKQHSCENLEVLGNAVKRATEVCTCMHMPLQENFKVVFRSQGGEVIQDWRLSPLAYLLTVINSDSKNDVVARLQVEMVKRMLHQE